MVAASLSPAHFHLNENIIDIKILTDRAVQYILPVSIDSSRMQFPDSRAASHCIVQPDDGISSISPGTRNLVSNSVDVPSLFNTLAQSLCVTVLCNAN